MRLARFESETQRFAGTQKVALSYDIVERARPQPLGERRCRFPLGEEIIH